LHSAKYRNTVGSIVESSYMTMNTLDWAVCACQHSFQSTLFYFTLLHACVHSGC